MEQFPEECQVDDSLSALIAFCLFLLPEKLNIISSVRSALITQITLLFRRMRDEEDLIDITFACEGKKIGAHKLVLFSCSPYFKDLLKDNQSTHPIFFFHDISYDILKAILEYMYLGEVHITNDNLKDFIRVAEALQIRGLSKDTSTTVSG
jgi:BTB/POZ domain